MSYYEGKPRVSKETIEDVKKCPIKAIPERKLTEETCKAYGIRTAYNPETMKPSAHYFPHHKGSEIVGFVKRDLTKPKKLAWSVVGDISVKTQLFGQGVGNDKRKVTIVEGMYDAPSVYQAQMENLRKWEAKNGRKSTIVPSVVSISLGTGNAKAQVANNIGFISEHDEIVICFDSDESTPEQSKIGEVYGQDAVMHVSMVLPDLRNVILSKKDPNEFLVDGETAKLASELMNHQAYSPSSVVTGGGDLEALLKPIGEGIRPTCFPKLFNLMKGIRPFEFSIILAPPKTGKSSMAKAIHYDLLKMGVKVFGCYLEETLDKTRQSFLALHSGVPLPVFRVNPSVADRNLVNEAHTSILHDSKAFFYDDKMGKISINNVMPTLEWAANQGVKVVIFDHFQFVVSNDTGDNERRKIDNLMNEVASYCKRTGVHVIGITHITYNKNHLKPKNDDGTVKYPYWYEVGEHDGRGSSAYAHVCSNLIGIDKEYTADGQRGRTRLKVLLNREWDLTGIADVLTMDKSTGRFLGV